MMLPSSPRAIASLSALALALLASPASARELRDYSPFTQFSSTAAQTLSPGTELTAAATVAETSKPLLSALEQRYNALEGRAPAATTPFMSFHLAAVGDETAAQPASNVWVAGSQTWLKNTTRLVDYAGDQTGVTVGADHKFWPNVVLGAAVTHENLDINTRFNRGRVETNGVTFAPYLVWTIGGPFTFDATAGYTRSTIEQSYAPTLLAGGVHSNTYAHRGMLAGNLNYNEYVDEWILGGKLGTLLVAEKVGSFTDSAGFSYQHQTNTLGQVQVGPTVGRIASWGSFGVSAAYLYDYNHLETVSLPGGAPPPIDRDGVLLSGNVSATVAKGVAVNLTVSREVLRDNVHNTNLAAMLAVSF